VSLVQLLLQFSELSFIGFVRVQPLWGLNLSWHFIVVILDIHVGGTAKTQKQYCAQANADGASQTAIIWFQLFSFFSPAL
jgi:hypothetical protein